ncbi:MAG: putative manganese-dependent inorganic diphosphatase [Bacilli bacterium]
MEKIFIIGHKKPDTDSVVSSIALSYLKNKLGYNTSPMVLGNINNETNFVLKYFKTKTPDYLNDVKLQLKDLNYQKKFLIEQHQSIEKAFLKMSEYAISSIPVINNKNIFLGTASMKDIAKDLIGDDNTHLCTSYTNIVNTIKGTPLLKINQEIKGCIKIASYRSTTFKENVKLDSDTILILGDRHSVIEHAILSKIKLIILTGNADIKKEHLKLATKNKINIIKTKYDTFNTSRRIILANYVSNITTSQKIVCFNELENVHDFIEIANKTKYSNYPIINNKQECLGILRLADVNDKKRKQVILVDHNELDQSVDGINEADIIEIIDHHKIGNIGTMLPIYFRNMPVGSTSTIIYNLFKENNIEIPKNIAGLMLAGIISDTLLFASPTTTTIDKIIANNLAKIAQINCETFAKQMFLEGSSLKGKTKEEILYSDFKNFTINNQKIGIGQINTFNINEINKHQKDYLKLIENIAKNNDYLIIALFAIDIINKGSYIYFNNNSKDILENSFNVTNLTQGYYLKNCISRKKQIIPVIMNTLEKNSY